jgi:hypothetical protein
MEWYINTGGAIAIVNEKSNPTEGFIKLEQFEFFIGKKIKWNKRMNKRIILTRDKNRIKVFDKQFIVGEQYRYKRQVYICEYINNDGTALLTPKSNTLKAITVKNSIEWEII